MDLTGSGSLVVIVVGWWAMGIPTGREKGPVELARFDRSTLGVFPVQVFAYTCAQNVGPLRPF
jgi:amino acid permease